MPTYKITIKEGANDWAEHKATEYEHGYDKHIEFCIFAIEQEAVA